MNEIDKESTLKQFKDKEERNPLLINNSYQVPFLQKDIPFYDLLGWPCYQTRSRQEQCLVSKSKEARAQWVKPADACQDKRVVRREAKKDPKQHRASITAINKLLVCLENE